MSAVEPTLVATIKKTIGTAFTAAIIAAYHEAVKPT
jgi:hypothetical protein